MSNKLQPELLYILLFYEDVECCWINKVLLIIHMMPFSDWQQLFHSNQMCHLKQLLNIKLGIKIIVTSNIITLLCNQYPKFVQFNYMYMTVYVVYKYVYSQLAACCSCIATSLAKAYKFTSMQYAIVGKMGNQIQCTLDTNLSVYCEHYFA